MKILSVEDYYDFECIGGDCPISCCGGKWGVLVDEESAGYYKKVEGDFGDRLRAGMREKDGMTFFRMDEKGDCVFLDEHKLCDIYKHLGGDRLCYTCQTYPRFYYQVGDILFCHLTNSCPEVNRRIFQRKTPLQVDFSDQSISGNVDENTDWKQFNFAIQAYTAGMDLLQNRRLKMQDRMGLLIVFVNQFQQMLREKRDPSGLIALFSAEEAYAGLLKDVSGNKRDFGIKIRAFSIVFTSLLQISYEHPMWQRCNELAECLEQGVDIDQGSLEAAFAKMDTEELQMELEQMMSYRFFAAFMQGFEKTDYYEQLIYEYVLLTALMTYNALTEVVQKQVCTQEDRILYYALCSRTDHDDKGKNILKNEIEKGGLRSLENVLRLIR